MGQESSALREAGRASWLLRLLSEMQSAGAYATFSWRSSIHRLLVRFSLPTDFIYSPAWLSRHIVVFRNRYYWSHLLDNFETMTWPDMRCSERGVSVAVATVQPTLHTEK
jgi:hypothetical protein